MGWRAGWGVRIVAAVLPLISATNAEARTLAVGPARALHLPSQAAAIAASGDRIEIDPGTYEDCAVWRADHLTVAGTGPGVVIENRICQGKAIFVIDGADVTLTRLTLRHARAPEHNGAGIRAEGGDLTLRAMHLIDNEDGLLAAPAPAATILIEDSEFAGNGVCAPVCAHGIYVNDLAKLIVRNSRFLDTHSGHHIKSRARASEIIGNTIADGPRGTSSYLVDLPNGGALLMRGNVLEKGPHTENAATAIAIGEEGVTHAGAITLSGNRFTNDGPAKAAFVRNLSETPARLRDNHFAGAVIPLIGPGESE